MQDPRVDAYIEKAAPFAQVLLRFWRELVHAQCPGVEETIKWGFPHFMWGGRILTSMAAFKAHASIGFWQGEAVTGASERREGMGDLGKLTALSDLPPKAELRAMLSKAQALIDQGVKPRRQARQAPRPLPDMPPALKQALSAVPTALAFFDGLPPGHRREYIDWIAEAKREETREKRIAQAVEWLSEGKRRNWKYENC
ncbi:MAG TPA: YdeI/OmpD-associated family protein [Burkholderiaceae bacterium]|nr:YdeI/OmpD-associated family protein [Burkholderiaceae bacterium]